MIGWMSAIYGALVERRNKGYDLGKKPVVHVTRPVISVGNLSVGGTGKTPVVQMFVRLLQDLGYRPAVVLRGYRRASRGLVVVHDGKGIRSSVRDAGDEAYLHAHVLSVPVVVHEYKAEGAVYAAGHLPCNIIVVDDGFQHRALHRDVDVVLVDRPTLSDQRLLPIGRLREPTQSLLRASVVLAMDDVSEEEVRGYCRPDAIVARVRMMAAMPELEGQRVVCMCGIANPERFIRSARACGAVVVDSVQYPDHHWYTKQEVENVIARARGARAGVVTTQKDVVKLPHAHELFERAGVSFFVLPIEAQLASNTNSISKLLEAL